MAKEEIIVDTSKEVLQSYLLTVAGRDWGIYAEKFLLKLVEAAQGDLQGMDFKRGGDMKPHSPSLDYPGVTKTESGDVFVDIPVRSLLPSEEYKNYQFVRDTIEQLQTKVLHWEAPKLDAKGNCVYDKDGNIVRKWKSVQLVGEAEGETDIDSCIRVRINTNIWKAMVDFTKGFRAFDLSIAMRLQSKYSLRLYQLMSRQGNPLTFTIEELKQQWGIEDKYDRPDDFIKRTIIPAKEELDAISPYTFEYKPNKSNTPGRGNKPVTSITFFPKHQIQYESTRAIKGFDEVGMMLKEPVKRILKEKYNFEWYELQTTFELLYTAQKTMIDPDLLNFLVDSKFARNASVAKDPKKYIIGSIKRHLKEKYDVVFKSKKELAAEEKLRKMADKKAESVENTPKLLGDIFK